jgi:hypothetical protein
MGELGLGAQPGYEPVCSTFAPIDLKDAPTELAMSNFDESTELLCKLWLKHLLL